MTKAQQLAEKEYPYVSPKSKSACEYNAQQKRRREGYIKGYNAKQKELEDALRKIINNWGNLHPKDRQQARAALNKET